MTIFTEGEISTERARARRLTSAARTEEIPVYIARPREEAQSQPALVLMQEAFGMNGHIRDLCCRYARQGYVVIAPDVYFRTGEWLTFEYDDPDTAETRLRLIDDLTEYRIAGDLRAVFDHLIRLPGVDPNRVGILGYCLGGKLAYMAAYLWPGLFKAVAVFYGGGVAPDPKDPSVGPVARTSEIEAPLIGFFGGMDSHIPREAVELISRSLEVADVRHALYWYPHADHGFSCNERPAYNPSAAQDAWHKSLEWFEETLGPISEPRPLLS